MNFNNLTPDINFCKEFYFPTDIFVFDLVASIL